MNQQELSLTYPGRTAFFRSTHRLRFAGGTMRVTTLRMSAGAGDFAGNLGRRQPVR